MPDGSIMGQYPVGRWKVGGETIVLSVARIRESFRKRTGKHGRIYRKGQRVDSVGTDSRVWSVLCEFYNGNREPGVDSERQYPVDLNRMCDSADRLETGDLTLPTRGERRCVLESYDRTEEAGERDFAAVEFTFVEDNEDDAKASDFQAPSAQAVLRSQVTRAIKSAAESGADSLDMSDVNEFASDLEGLASGPGDFVADMEAKASALGHAIDRVDAAFSNASAEVRNEVSALLTDPSSARSIIAMRKLHGTVRRASIDKVGVGGEVVVRRYTRVVSIFDVAADVKQSVDRLMTINPGVDNLLEIPAGAPVRVFASTVP
jgi:hypothetical protein